MIQSYSSHGSHHLTCSGHGACFYLEPHAVVTEAVRTIQSAIAAGHAGIIAASGATLRAVLSDCRLDGRSFAHARADGRLLMLDADQWNKRLVVAGQAEVHRFHGLIGGKLMMLSHRFGAVHVYSEMVAQLCQHDEYAAAWRMEEMWNEISHLRQLDLVCGYPMDLFQQRDHARVLERIRSLHDYIIRS